MPPYTPAYDMDIDIPLPDSEPDNAAIVSPDELLQDPPELAEPAAETENPSEPAAPAAPTVPARPYQIPSIDFLQNGVSRAGDPAVDQEMKEKAGILVDTLKSFGVTVRITGIFRGPSVTRYEIQPAAGIKVSKITGLADDIALSLAAQGVRIEAPFRESRRSASKSPTATRTPFPCGRFWRATASAVPRASWRLPWGGILPATPSSATLHGCPI